MTNSEKFQKVFGFYATEMWTKPEKEFLEWINSEALEYEEEPKTEEWIPCSERLPSEEGLYMVTQKTFSDDYRFIYLFHYGKPMMPNRKVKGACWYRSDSEWGDVVYDDTDIIAWMPLPIPYREGREDYELATEQMEHDIMYEPTYNSEDGSM